MTRVRLNRIGEVNAESRQESETGVVSQPAKKNAQMNTKQTRRPVIPFSVPIRASILNVPNPRFTLPAMKDPVSRLKKLMRDIPDFPKPGVMFRDITPLLADASGLALAIELLANPFRGKNIDLVVGAESRGFIFGTAVACCL